MKRLLIQPYPVPHRIGDQALYLGGRPATGRAGQAEPGCGYQSVPGFPDPGNLSGADHPQHLMSHTAGLRTGPSRWRLPALSSFSAGAVSASHLPAGLRPVGQISAYSNYGTDLAGYIVERISGMPFGIISRPTSLGARVDHTTARQPCRPTGSADVNGYRFLQDAFQPGAFELLSTQPSGSISSTRQTWHAL